MAINTRMHVCMPCHINPNRMGRILKLEVLAQSHRRRFPTHKPGLFHAWMRSWDLAGLPTTSCSLLTICVAPFGGTASVSCKHQQSLGSFLPFEARQGPDAPPFLVRLTNHWPPTSLSDLQDSMALAGVYGHPLFFRPNVGDAGATSNIAPRKPDASLGYAPNPEPLVQCPDIVPLWT